MNIKKRVNEISLEINYIKKNTHFKLLIHVLPVEKLGNCSGDRKRKVPQFVENRGGKILLL